MALLSWLAPLWGFNPNYPFESETEYERESRAPELAEWEYEGQRTIRGLAWEVKEYLLTDANVDPAMLERVNAIIASPKLSDEHTLLGIRMAGKFVGPRPLYGVLQYANTGVAVN